MKWMFLAAVVFATATYAGCTGEDAVHATCIEAVHNHYSIGCQFNGMNAVPLAPDAALANCNVLLQTASQKCAWRMQGWIDCVASNTERGVGCGSCDHLLADALRCDQ